MPTDNRRVAAYLPKSIDDCLEKFKTERGLKGDSPALLTILSEFFGVNQEVAYQNSSDILQRVEALESKLAQIKGELLSELKSGLLSLQVGSKDELLVELESSLPKDTQIPGQLELLQEEETIIREAAENQESNSESESKSEPSQSEMDLLELTEDLDQLGESLENKSDLPEGGSESQMKPLRGSELSARLKVKAQSLTNNKAKWDNEKFIVWTRNKDPNEVGWLFNPEDKLYYPVKDDSLVYF